MNTFKVIYSTGELELTTFKNMMYVAKQCIKLQIPHTLSHGSLVIHKGA